MRFKAIALIQVGSALAGVLVGVGMAWLHYGYWSLVGLNLTTGLVALGLTALASRWRPQFFTRSSGTRPMLYFGANLTAGAFFYSIARGLDGLLIGRFYGAVSVGLYSRALAMLARPLEQVMCPIESVLIPMFSRLQCQPERYQRVLHKRQVQRGREFSWPSARVQRRRHSAHPGVSAPHRFYRVELLR